MHGYRKDTPPQQFWTELLDEVRSAPQSRSIVSSEEFMRMGCYPEAAKMLSGILAEASDIDIRVIAYLREPEAHLKSWYNQLVKMGMPTPAYNTAAPAMMESIHFDYGLAMKPWVDLVGAEGVILRNYPGRQSSGDRLFEDFLSIFSLELPVQGIKLPAGDPNPRLDDSVVELRRVLKNAGLQEPAVQRMVDRTQRYFEAEGAGVSVATEQDFEALRQQSLTGLEMLEAMVPAEAARVALLRAHLPEREDPAESDPWRMAGLLLNEISVLRKSFAKTTRALDERLAALEAALDRQGGSET